MNKPIILVISGFSGVGKTTVIDDLLKRNKNLVLSKSHTTRAKRNNVACDHYVFIDTEQFVENLRAGLYIEHTEYASQCYGTEKEPILKALSEGKTCILDINCSGLQQILQQKNHDIDIKDIDIISIFLVCDADTLEKRLMFRKEKDIINRLQIAVDEIQLLGNYDFVIENTNVEKTTEKILQIIDDSFDSTYFDLKAFSEKFRKDMFKNLEKYLTENRIKMLIEKKIGDVLAHNEYAILADYYEKMNNYDSALAVLGAAFVNELHSMGNYATCSAISNLLNISFILMKKKNIYHATKIFKIATAWAEEERFVYPELKESIDYLQHYFKQGNETGINF